MKKFFRIISVFLLSSIIISQSLIISSAENKEKPLKAQIIKTIPFGPNTSSEYIKFKFKVNQKGFVKVQVLDKDNEVVKTLIKDKEIRTSKDKTFSLKWDFSKEDNTNERASIGTYKIKIVFQNPDKSKKTSAKTSFNIVDDLSVWIDAGHGGIDVGAIRIDGKYEREDNLKLARQVQKLLKKQGIKVYMSRTDKDKNYSSTKDLKVRIKKANKLNADLFVSLHRNAAAVSSANGFNIYTHNPKYKKNNKKTHAKNKTSVSMKLSKNIFKEVSKVSKMKMGEIIKGSNDKVDFFVNRLTNMPSCLVETGYVTNSSDNKEFDKNYKTYALAISKGIMKTLGVTYIE